MEFSPFDYKGHNRVIGKDNAHKNVYVPGA